MGVVALVYGVIAYLLFLASFLWFIAFVGGDGLLPFIAIPKTVDAGAPAFVFAAPALQNLCLILLFGVSHSVMARPGFKAAWTRIVPPTMERSTYVLVSTIVLVLLMHLWRPIPAIVWETGGAVSFLLLAVFAFGWGVLLLSTFLISHFDLFGLSQSWHAFRKTTPVHGPFRAPLLYRLSRHPLYLGFVIAFWAAPVMTAGHLLLAGVMTIYIFVAIGYEERDLITHFGDDYRRYMARVPQLFPFGVRKEGGGRKDGGRS